MNGEIEIPSQQNLLELARKEPGYANGRLEASLGRDEKGNTVFLTQLVPGKMDLLVCDAKLYMPTDKNRWDSVNKVTFRDAHRYCQSNPEYAKSVIDTSTGMVEKKNKHSTILVVPIQFYHIEEDQFEEIHQLEDALRV